MKTIEQLKAEKSKLLAEARALIDKSKREKREFTATEAAEVETKLERAREISDELESRKSINTPILPDPQDNDYPSRTPSGGGDREIKAMPARDRSFRGMFCRDGETLSNGGFRSFDEFVRVIHSQRSDPRLEGRAMIEGIGSQGGFAVPEEFGGWLLDKSLEGEIVRPRAQIWPMKSDTRKIPAWDGSDHTSNLFGGFSGAWLAEAGTATRTYGKLRLIALNTKKLACFTQTSNEVIADGIDFESQLGDKLIQAVGWYSDYAYLNGPGGGQPIGALNATSRVTVPKETGQAGATILYKNLIKMFARMHPACLPNSVWVANSTTIPQLLSLSLPLGTSDQYIPVMTESNGQFIILTRPVKFTEKVPALGTEGDISFIDFSQYAIGMRKEVFLEKSNAIGWMEDLSDYRVIIRVDGLPTWDKVITPKHGDTLSWCVTLATRS